MGWHSLENIIQRQFTGKRYCDAGSNLISHLHYNDEDRFSFPFAGDEVPVYTCRFCPSAQYSNIVAVANENGYVSLRNCWSRKDKQVLAHNNAIFDLCWVPNSLKYVTVSGDNTACLWDEDRCIIKCRGHSKSVKCVAFKPNNPSVFVTGGRDGRVMIWDIRVNHRGDVVEPDQMLTLDVQPSLTSSWKREIKKQRGNRVVVPSVTGVAFQDEHNLLTCCSNGCTIGDAVELWDMRKTYMVSAGSNKCYAKRRYQVRSNEGFSSICVSPSNNMLYASNLDSHIYAFRLNAEYSGPVGAFSGHRNFSFYIKSNVSMDGRYLMSGSSDDLGYIWDTKKLEQAPSCVLPVRIFSAHSAEVISVDMSYSGDMSVVTGSDDGSYILWRCTSSEKQYHREREWDEGLFIRPECFPDECKQFKLPNTLKRKLSCVEWKPKYNLASVKENVKDFKQLLNIEQKTSELKIENEVASPTANLPNYVIDGTSPYSHKCEYKHKMKENADWLTSIQKKRKLTIKPVTPEQKQTKDGVSSEKNKRNSENKRKKSMNCKIPAKRTLFEYFKPALDEINGNS